MINKLKSSSVTKVCGGISNETKESLHEAFCKVCGALERLEQKVQDQHIMDKIFQGVSFLMNKSEFLNQTLSSLMPKRRGKDGDVRRKKNASTQENDL